MSLKTVNFSDPIVIAYTRYLYVVVLWPAQLWVVMNVEFKCDFKNRPSEQLIVSLLGAARWWEAPSQG